ncbi:hypothetical protein VOLCADRAFT_91079 [Volvox carteri f. nagariensis]|uniref:Uncharacterized protein n=1 Tax=Volvox carteri f. nagariensis TaxID=3068 RepID=D8TW45_VOLCA|nr:uncharacterized protein VOLCADRAFT_91079 [Volvox carteri f. nagariensis]EFJ48414.1 hypothetical protein VOLCADRAFT_91079 [Volvox carteri f. nagariensis]|eukprot:XP_002950668.1 hypothetical protein VOLCADRAFT_91079 [Volvox carteri f. nagariensis]
MQCRQLLAAGDVEVALSYLQDDPLTAACTHFRDGSNLWHVAAASGHLLLLQALADRLTALWPTPGEPTGTHHGGQQQRQQQQPEQQPQPQYGAPSFWRLSNPFLRCSDGFRRRGPDSRPRLPLAALVNAPNVLGQTALMAACKGGHPGCVQFLLSMGANPWYRDRANCTALHYATLHDQGPAIEALLQHQASARPPPGTRQSFVRLVDVPNFCGYTAAHFAAVANKPRALAALLACGANIAARCWSEGSDWISGPPGSTPLHLAARRGDVALCKMIMSHYLEVLRDSGAPDPRLHADVRGVRPYQRAAERGSRGLAEMLMPSTPLSYILGSLSRASSFVNGAIQFVRRQSLRPLDSFRRRLRASGRGAQAQDGSQHDRATSRRTSTVGGASETAAGGLISLSCYDGAAIGGGGGGGNRVGSGVYSQFSHTPPLHGGMPPAGVQRPISCTTMASASAATMPGIAIEHGFSAETAAIAAGGTAITAAVTAAAADAASHGLAGSAAGAGADAAAGLTPSLAVVAVAKTAAAAAAAALSGDISPVRGNSFDSDTHFPYLPSPPYHLVLATDGGRSGVTEIRPAGAAAAAAAAAGCGDVHADPANTNARASALVGGADGPTTVGGIAGGSPANETKTAFAPFRTSYCPVSLPVSLPPPPLQHPYPSPFAVAALQATPLDRCSGASPGGGSPRYSSVSGVDVDICRSLSGWSPPLPVLLPPPGASLGLQPIQEGHPTGLAAAAGGGGGCDGCLAGRLSRRASKYVLTQPPPQPSPLPHPGPDDDVGGRSPPALPSRGSSCWQISGDSVRRWGLHGGSPAAATAGMGGDDRVIAREYYMTGRAVAGGGGGGGSDPAGGSPPLGVFQLPVGLGWEAYGSGGVAGGGGSYGQVIGLGVAATAASRAGSGRLRVSAECSREVTRMVVTQPPSCPFCRGVVHGFGL